MFQGVAYDARPCTPSQPPGAIAMDPRELKPLLTALVLPPAGPLLLAFAGLLLARRRRAAGLALAAAGLLLAFLLSTNGVALLLSRHLLQPLQAAHPDAVRQQQAIVVLGGGVLPQAPEYGAAQPSAPTLGRLRYAIWLAQQTGKPIAFAGGVGWAATGTPMPSEGAVARAVAQKEYGIALRWVDEGSRDSAENAARMAQQLQGEGVRRIALVTDATHMERAAAAFRNAGFDVLPAPTHFPVQRSRPLLEWLPSDQGAATCRQLLREWLGRLVAKAG